MTPIAPLITNFLREHLPVERGCSPHTCQTYAHAFRLLFIFASKASRDQTLTDLHRADRRLTDSRLSRSPGRATWQWSGHAQRTTRCGQSLYAIR